VVLFLKRVCWFVIRPCREPVDHGLVNRLSECPRALVESLTLTGVSLNFAHERSSKLEFSLHVAIQKLDRELHKTFKATSASASTAEERVPETVWDPQTHLHESDEQAAGFPFYSYELGEPRCAASLRTSENTPAAVTSAPAPGP